MLEITSEPLEVLNNDAGYRGRFMNLELWKSYVEWVYTQHFSSEISTIRPGLAGSFPTFVVNDMVVIKFFGVLFEGGQSFEIERTVNHLLALDPRIPAPELLAEGCLFPDGTNWSWPYLVFSYLPGLSLGEVIYKLSLDQQIAIANQLGAIIRRLHAIPLPSKNLSPAGFPSYETFLQYQRIHCVESHLGWGDLPPRLISQIEDFLPPPDHLFETPHKPILIHADLTRDHLLGRLERKRWITSGLIDFGDAMPGELAYELIALHLDMFACHKHLLSTFLDSYGLPLNTELCDRAMTATLLHRFPVIEVLKGSYPPLSEITTLQELANYLWHPDHPGFIWSEYG